MTTEEAIKYLKNHDQPGDDRSGIHDTHSLRVTLAAADLRSAVPAALLLCLCGGIGLAGSCLSGEKVRLLPSVPSDLFYILLIALNLPSVFLFRYLRRHDVRPRTAGHT